MCVQFVPKSHLFFTGGKDKKIKQWDADNFEHIMTLEGHHAEVWSLCISSSGNILVSASHDKSLRLWEKTEEMLVLDEEKEMVFWSCLILLQPIVIFYFIYGMLPSDYRPGWNIGFV